MSNLDKAWIEKYQKMGVDLTLLSANLKKTPQERVLHHHQMLALVEEAKKARAFHAPVRTTYKTT